jgi:hypothetical protein
VQVPCADATDGRGRGAVEDREPEYPELRGSVVSLVGHGEEGDVGVEVDVAVHAAE